MQDRKQHINEIAARCQAPNSDEAYRDLYAIMLPEWKRRWREDVRTTLGDYGEIESLYNYTLFMAVRAWDPKEGDFEHMFNKRIRQRKIDLFRVNSRRINRREREVPKDAEDDDRTAILESYEDPSADFQEAVIRKRDQRQLISLLAASIDDQTRCVIKMFLAGDSYATIGKSLGIKNHETVRRYITRLARRFDESRMGSLRDYVAV